MNPIPPAGTVPTTSLPVDGTLELVVLVTLATISVIFVMMLWSLFDMSQLDPHKGWPRRLGAADGRRDKSDGTRIEVIRPSQLSRRSSRTTAA